MNTDGAAHDPFIGQTFGHYRILKRIGEGGMGVVFLADDTSLHREVALKFLPPGMQRDPAARMRFTREAHSAAVLDHPYICSIHEVAQSDGKDFIVMEYVDGPTLREKLAHGPFPLKEALQIAIEVAEALEAAHARGIVHRDIKPENIMLSRAGHAKVMDFGLAKHLIPSGGIETQEATVTALTRDGSTVGTLAYMSPEQLRGETADSRSDVFSLGIVLYEMLAGIHPFKQRTGAETIGAILTARPPSLAQLRPDIPTELNRAITHALEKKTESRYSSAEAMQRDLRNCVENLQASTGQLNLGSLVRSTRKPRIVIPGMLILLAAVSLSFWLVNRQAKIRWARNDLLPQIDQLIQNRKYRDFEEAYSLAVKAERYIPKDPKLVAVFEKVSTHISIITEPPVAKIYIKQYPDPDTEWVYLGLSPIENLRMPYAYLRFKMEKDGYETVLGASASAEYDSKLNKMVPSKIQRRLDKKADIPSGMVRITGGEVEKIGKIDDFFMDRFEVTNKQYEEFIENGGYRKKEYWKNRFVKDGKELTWEQALSEFVDSTGRPGPAVWQGGDYPEGREDFAVSGVSWYEAAAYAEYAGKSLPTSHHWDIGSGGLTTTMSEKGIYEFFTPQSNFKGRGPERVGSNPAITPYGVYDMGGNVREWCWNETKQGRVVRGGAYNDVPYMFDNVSQISPFDRSPKNGFRTALYIHPEQIPKSAFASVEPEEFPDFYKQKPVADPGFQVYKEQYSYDKKDLNARVEERDGASKDWIKEKISFDAAYENERLIAYLFLPKNSLPPYQTVIYFPGSLSVMLKSSQDIERQYEFETWLMPIVKSGRAVLYPVYKGTFERGSDAIYEIHTGDKSHQYTEFFIKVVKDFRKCIDYLETRPDIDSQKLAYLGFSWGGMYGAIIPAVEERLKASVLNVGGMSGVARPEVNEINYISRVKIPCLMMNGRYDMTFPYELAVKPMFDLMGTPPSQKELKVYDTDHFIPRNEFIKETLRFLDKYLGPVKYKE